VDAVDDPRRPALLALLAGHRPADAEEAGHLERLRDLLDRPGRPFDRGGFEPGHVTAGAFVLHPEGGRVLMVHHRRLGIWVQPGGHVEPGDPDAQAAALREAVEETGVGGLRPMGLLDVDVHRFPAQPGGDPGHLHFDVRFAFAAGSSLLAPGAEVGGVRWAAPDDLTGMGADRSVWRPVARLLDLS
jgi:8-oxo-dGTP pyrophosphatase MutT (NUDIX family)